MSGRTITPAGEEALADGQVRAVVFVEMSFPSGFLRLNTSAVPLLWNGYEWLGAGKLGNIEPVSEGSTLEARGLTFTITGLESANISIAVGQQYQGRPCNVWLAPLDENYALIPDPVLIFSGRLDVMDVEIGETAAISVTAESRLADWDRPRIRRYNAEDQKLTDPTDQGLDFVPAMVEKELLWGA